MTGDPATHADMGVLVYRVNSIELTLAELKNSHKSIALSLQQLVLLEQRHQDTRGAMDKMALVLEKIDLRVQSCEEVVPTVSRLVKANDRLHGAVWTLAISCIGAAFLFLWHNAELSMQPSHSPTERPQK